MADFDVHRLSQIRRINVVGTPGSGKTTFGRRLAEVLGLPFVEMDQVYWGRDWAEPTDEVSSRSSNGLPPAHPGCSTAITREPSVKWRHVELVVWLDLSFPRTIYRVTARCIRRSLDRTELWPGTGNRETLRKAFFSRESVIYWAMTTFGRYRRGYSRLMGSEEYRHVWFVHLTSPHEVESFLQAAEIAT